MVKGPGFIPDVMGWPSRALHISGQEWVAALTSVQVERYFGGTWRRLLMSSV